MSRALQAGPTAGLILAAALAALAPAGPVVAQSAAPPNPLANPPAERPGTIIGGQPTASFERCLDVQIGSENAFGCLNQKLRREVDKVNPSLNLPPIDAHSSDVRVGNVNEAAIRQQYGSNYGRSAVPFRPPTAPSFVPPRH
jgi:hypothetical protein